MIKTTLRQDLGPLVGNLIAVRRRKREWSVAELARRCGVSRQAIWLAEQGTTLPSWELAYAIANSFDCEVGDLFPTRRELALD